MAGKYNEDVELDLYFKDRSSLYDGWDNGDMYDFTPSFTQLSLKPLKPKNNKQVVNTYMYYNYIPGSIGDM